MFGIDNVSGEKLSVCLGDPNDILIPNPIPLHSWTHLAVTYNDPDLCLYMNGHLVGTGSTSYLVSGSFDWWYGDYSGVGWGTWSGSLVEFTIWNTALSQSELQTKITESVSWFGITTGSDLVGYWRFNDSSSDKVENYFTGGYDWYAYTGSYSSSFTNSIELPPDLTGSIAYYNKYYFTIMIICDIYEI